MFSRSGPPALSINILTLLARNSIALEEANREQVYGRYDLARSRLADGFSTSAPSNIVTSLLPAFDTLAVNYDVSASNPTSLAEAIALGKSLIESKPAVPVATKKGAKKGKGKGKEREKDLSMVIEEVDDLETKMTEIRLQVRLLLLPSSVLRTSMLMLILPWTNSALRSVIERINSINLHDKRGRTSHHDRRTLINVLRSTQQTVSFLYHCQRRSIELRPSVDRLRKL